MRVIIYICLLVVFLSSCDEPTRLDVKQTPSRIVIEGLVTDRPGLQYVKVTRSVAFYTSGKSPRVENASVQVSDDEGGQVQFMNNPHNHPDSAGIYVPDTKFVGEIGKTYTLTVDVDGETYEGSDALVRVIDIDSLAFRENANQKKDPKEAGKFYEVLMYAHEPQNEDNYYLFKFFRNDSLKLYNPTDIYYSDDNLLAGNINGVSSPVYFGREDRARIEVYSLTRRGYVFYNDLSTILNNDGGGMFGPVPASPRSNLSNGALGFFQVSAVQDSETVIE
jgi:hypothetical protein